MENGPTAADLLAAVLDLARKVESYESATMKLGARMRQPDNMDFVLAPWSDDLQRKGVARIPRDLAGAMLVIDELRRHLEGIDLHMGAIRAHLDAIQHDADQRLTFRSWLDARER